MEIGARNAVGALIDAIERAAEKAIGRGGNVQLEVQRASEDAGVVSGYGRFGLRG